MNKSAAIFQEIESKLAKDHYASQLPQYHPAKGRRKRTLKEPKVVYQKKEHFLAPSESKKEAIGFTDFSTARPDKPFPDTPPEIEKPDQEEIFPPGEREIDPGRDFPQRDIPDPDEEELPGEKPAPEVDDPDTLNNI